MASSITANSPRQRSLFPPPEMAKSFPTVFTSLSRRPHRTEAKFPMSSMPPSEMSSAAVVWNDNAMDNKCCCPSTGILSTPAESFGADDHNQPWHKIQKEISQLEEGKIIQANMLADNMNRAHPKGRLGRPSTHSASLGSQQQFQSQPPHQNHRSATLTLPPSPN